MHKKSHALIILQFKIHVHISCTEATQLTTELVGISVMHLTILHLIGSH